MEINFVQLLAGIESDAVTIAIVPAAARTSTSQMAKIVIAET